MKSGYIAGCVVGLSLWLVGCSDTPAPAPDTSAADQKAIKDGEIAWGADFASKDADKLVAHYADDATVMMPDTPLMSGKGAIRAGITPILADKNFSLSFTNSMVATSKSGDIAYSQGTYSMTTTNPKTKKPVTEKGKYLTVYKKQTDGSWKAIEDMNNADAPATPVVMASARKSAPPARKKRKK